MIKKNCRKNRKTIFRTKTFSGKKSMKKSMKIKNFDFSDFFRKYFSENRVMKKISQTVFGCTFSKNKYFYLNPKVYETA